MLNEIPVLETMESPITVVNAVMQAIGTTAMPEMQEQIEVDTQDNSSVSLQSADEVLQAQSAPGQTGGCLI